MNGARALRTWSPSISEVDIEPFFKGLPSEEGFAMRAQMAIADMMGLMKFVRLRFAG